VYSMCIQHTVFEHNHLCFSLPGLTSSLVPACFIMVTFAIQIFALWPMLTEETEGVYSLQLCGDHAVAFLHFQPLEVCYPLVVWVPYFLPFCWFRSHVSALTTSFTCSLLRKTFMGLEMKLKSKTCPASSAKLGTLFTLLKHAIRLTS
jgi:hypothetical protein